MSRLLPLSALVTLVTLAAGCSSDSDDSGGGSGVPRSTKMSELTLEQATAECRAHESDFEKVRFTACKFEGLSEADSATCEETIAYCESLPATLAGGIQCDSVDVADLEGCEVTVGEFTGCLGDLARYLDTIDCTTDVGMTPELPACWGALADRCPLFQ